MAADTGEVMVFPRLPDFLIIGAAKAGTTTLYDILHQHRQVGLSSAKEPGFFCDDEEYARGSAWYRDTYFSEVGDAAVVGEATPRYLYWGDTVVPRLEQEYGDPLPKLIAIFRDPVALVQSFYWHSVREGRESLPLADALAAEPERMARHGQRLRSQGLMTFGYRRIAQYATQLQPYLARVPRERCLFLLTDDLRDFDTLLRTLETFLAIDHDARVTPVVSNSAALPRSQRVNQWLRARSPLKELAKRVLPFPVRHRLKMRAIDANLKPLRTPPMDGELALGLRRHYAGEMQALERLIGRDLSSWYAEI